MSQQASPHTTGSNADADDRARLTRLAAAASILVAIILVTLKSWAVWRTGSASMLGSLADSALDLVASMVTLIGVWVAAMPADNDHRFGHGKAEAIAAMVQVVLIALSAFGIFWRSAEQLIEGTRVAAPVDGISVSVIAIALTMALLAWQRFVIARTRSVAINTDHLHYKSDLLLNFAVIVALALDAFAGVGSADPLFGIAIAIWLGWNAWQASQEAVDHLMDREWPDEKRRELVEIAARHPELASLHDLRTRTSGNRDFVQFHVDLPGEMTVSQSHDIIERVEEDMLRQFPGVELLIHIDPEGHVDEPGNPLAETDELEKLEKER